MKKRVFIIIAACIGIIAGILIQPVISGDNILQQVKKFDYVLNTAFRNYVDEVDSQKLLEAAIKGMLNELDVHSVFISAEEMKRVNEDFQASFDGIGVEFDIVNDTLTIVSPIPGGPSEQLGIQSGDKIIKIDGVNAIGISRADVPKKLKGPKGTIVEIDIKRNGVSDLIHYSITRDKIPLFTVDASYIIDGTDIGVVSVNRFAATTHQELLEAMNKLKAQGMKRMILDLRGNPGGYMNEAIKMADEFLPRGDTIVYTRSRVKSFDEVHIATSGQQFEKMPLIVLINAGSASASEIVSGALQDQDRALIVGETSYGKGLVQRQYEIGDGSAFRLTISRYYTPSGRSIQRPYQDKDKYRHLVGRFVLEEGSYLEDPIGKIRAQISKLNEKESDNKINIDSLPLYQTRHGRTVFGGGGINPDFIIKSDTITQFSAKIRNKDVFYAYTDSYLQGKGKSIKAKYENNFSDFLRNFHVSNDMMKDFRALVESKGIEWDEASAKIDDDYFRIIIKANIARSIWDRSKMLQVISYMDKQMLEAMKLFPAAEKLSMMK